MQTYYAPNTTHIRFQNPSDRGRRIEKDEITAFYKLTLDTSDSDSCKAINVYGDHQAVNNKKGFAVESQQNQDDLRITKEYLTKELQLDQNPILKADMNLMHRIKKLCFKYKELWSGGENGASGRCKLFKFAIDLNGKSRPVKCKPRKLNP